MKQLPVENAEINYTYQQMSTKTLLCGGKHKDQFDIIQ
jgi:hypothetical protein